MKKQLFLIAFFGFIILIANGLCFADDTIYQFRLPKFNEPVYGTWVNEDYAGTADYPKKFNMYKWGYSESYYKAGGEDLSSTSTYILVEKWEDADGNVWYKDFEQTPGGGQYYFLIKISKDGSTFESMGDMSNFPKENSMNPNRRNYRIFYRQ